MRPKVRKQYLMEIRERSAANIKKQKRSDNMKNPINSKSCIIITCPDDAQPCLSRIKIRNAAGTIIQLNPGINILTIEQYPDLKYGFISDFNEDELPENFDYPSHWGDNPRWQVTSVDMSHFDGKEMTSMVSMFDRFEGERIVLANLDTSNVKDMAQAFNMSSVKHLALDLNTSNVTDVSQMFYGANIERLVLKGFDLRNVTNFKCMFENAEIDTLIIDDWIIEENKCSYNDGIFEECNLPNKIIIRNCLPKTVEWIAENAVNAYGEDALNHIKSDNDVSCQKLEDGWSVLVY